MRQSIILSVAIGTIAAFALGLSACGGGGGGGGGSSSSSGSSSSGSGSGGSGIAGSAANVATAEVDGGPSGVNALNVLYVTVTVCAPGSTTNCQSIPYIQVDTGSYGLRIIGSALNSSLYSALPAETSTSSGTSGQPLAECTQWADGYSWGPVVSADIQVGGQAGGQTESASNVVVQVIGASNYATIPTDCTDTGPNGEEDTIATFGANGIIGVGPFVQDCGPACASSPGLQATYYTCATPSSCTDEVAGTSDYVTVADSQQVSNPVAFFAKDNNGVIIELPSIPAAGQATVTGSVVFGIGTESNNALGSATVLDASPDYGTITTVFNGQTLNGSYFDTGSNGYFFADSSIAQCGSNDQGFYCPATTLSLSATLEPCTSANSSSLGCSSSNSATMNVNFSVGDLNTLDGSFAADNELGGTLPSASGSPFTGVFDWGLSFFYGRNVYVAIACGADDSGVSGCATGAPFFAIGTQ
jgi:hypothetical protein